MSNKSLTESQIYHLCRVVESRNGFDCNEHGARLPSLHVLHRLGLTEVRDAQDRHAREMVRRTFATPAGIAELRRLATDATLDPRLALRVRGVLADVNGLSPARARVYATIAASPRAVSK